MNEFQRKKIKALEEVDTHVTLALAKLNTYAGGAWTGSLRELKDLVGVKLKLEQIQRRVHTGTKWYKRRIEQHNP